MDFQVIDANTMFGFDPTHRLDMSVERLIGEMDRYRIAGSLTLATTGVFCDHVLGNSMTIQAAHSNQRLVGAGTVNPQAYYGSAQDMQAIVSQGFRLFRFFPDEQGWPIDSAAFRQVLVQLAPTKAPIMVDAAVPGEPTRAAGVTNGYPGTVILSSVSEDSFAEAIAVMTERPNVVIETHELHMPGALRVLVDKVGAERIVFGSGAPRRSSASSLHYVLNSELSDAEKQAILGGNIKRILEAR